MIQALFVSAAVLFGACVGSFLNVVILRLPHGTFLSGGKRSHCPKCRAPIAWYDNIPVFSWVVLLRGKARCCGQPISARYPLVEAITAALIGFLAWWVIGRELPGGLEPGGSLRAVDPWLTLLFQAWFVSVMIACTFIDIDLRILPDKLTKPTMVVGLFAALMVEGFAGRFSAESAESAASSGALSSLAFSALGLGTGYLLTELVRVGGARVFRKEAMGMGDVKFMAAIGAFVGWDGALCTFFVGSVLGAVYGIIHQLVTKEPKIFFGPFLAAGALISLFWRGEIVHFVTVTWPSFTAGTSPMVSGGIALLCGVLMVVIIRRGRSQ